MLSALCHAAPREAPADAAERAATAEVEVDDAIPAYVVGPRIAGTFRTAGSPTTGTLLEVIHAGFAPFHPDVTIDVTWGGASTGAPSLIAGSAQLAHMSRRFTDAEVSAFRAKFSYPPTEIPIAMDALAIFVHRDNPIESLTIEQLRDAFSQRRRADGSRLDHWSELSPASTNVTAAPATRPATTRASSPPTGLISLYGIAADRGESAVFREAVLGDDPFSAALRVQLTQSSAVQAVAADPAGIAYATSLYACRGVRAVPLISPADARAYPCSDANCRSGRYPLARSLYVYVNKPPNKPLDRAIVEFLRFALSRDGQRLVVSAGAFPLSAEADRQALQIIER
jgi:phosphate transport system substrate-binding protein